MDGKPAAPCRVRTVGATLQPYWYEVTLTEGRKRQVRRMMEALGHRVVRLVRIAFAGLGLKGVPAGSWRALTRDEVQALRARVGLDAE